jgi:hypothetical protein
VTSLYEMVEVIMQDLVIDQHVDTLRVVVDDNHSQPETTRERERERERRERDRETEREETATE